ncbi:MAG: type II secretion system F family protein [Phycisphaerales bacterium]|nr:MAG: type II secretion system F family protein [Phycisphaerales bacterium]
MLNFTFKAKTDEGTLVSGDMLADRRETVVNALRQKGYHLLSVEEQSRLLSIFRAAELLSNRVSVRERAIFTHQLATLLRAGMRLSVALKTLTTQTQNKYLISVIEQLRTDIEQSSSLSRAMAKHPRVFSKVYTAIIEAAEESGTLAETLSILSEQLKAKASVNARIKGAMVYPIFLLVVSAVVVTVLTAFVVPKFIDLFVTANQKLPLPTEILVGTTTFFRSFWWAFLLTAAGITLLSVAALRGEHVRLHLDGLLLRLPVIGTLNRKLQLARFSRTLGSLLNGGVRIVSAVETTRGTTVNRAFSTEIANIGEAIMDGSTLANAIRQQQYFSEIASNIIAIGEDTGTLPEMLLEVAEMYDQECESAIGSMTNLLGPVMIVILGLIIGFVVMAILLPVFETSTMVG